MNRKFYMMLCLILCLHATTNYAQTFDLGEINHAKYKIYIPENWNKGLVMYAHGYEEIGEETEKFTEEVDEFMEIFTSRGFAFAASAYKRQGLVIKDGIEDTEALRAYFEMEYGKPDICIITGHSMGGIISLATIEKYPYEYDGAMPLCGWLAPVYSLAKYSFDILVTYDYLFDKNNGEVVNGESFIEPEKIQQNLDKKPELAKLYAEHFRLKEEDLSEVIAFYQYVIKESFDLFGEGIVGNMQTIYCGFGFTDKKLNKNIRRYRSDPQDMEYFVQYYTPTGEIQDPVITLHTTYDELLPVHSYAYYEQLTQIKHTADLYVQQYIVRDGHCNFTLEEHAEIFDQMLRWINEGQRPELK